MPYDLDNNPEHAESPFVPVLQSVVDIANMLMRRWWAVLLGVALGAFGGYQMSMRMPDEWQALSRMIVDVPPAPPPSPGADATDLMADRKMALQRRVEAIRSIPVADIVHRIMTGKIDLTKNPAGDIGFAPAPANDSTAGAKVQDLVDQGLEERLKEPAYLANLLKIRQGINVAIDVDASILTISAFGYDPKELPVRANTYFQAYRAYCLAQKTSYERRMIRTIQTSLDGAKLSLARAEGLESSYRKQHRLQPRSRDRREHSEQSAAVAAEAARLLAEKQPGNASVESRLAAHAEKGIQMRHTILQEALRSLDQLLDLQEEFAPEHPSITAKQLEILGLQDSAGELDGVESGAPRRATYEQELAAELVRPGNSALERGAFVLARTVAIADSLYSATGTLQREVQVRNALASPDVHLVEPATLPSKPIGPDRPRTIRNGAALGFGLVFVVLLMMEYGDARVRGASAVAKFAGVPVIATLTHEVELENRPPEESIIVQEGSFAPLAEAMRELRTRLMFSGPTAAGKTLLVTSAFSGDGKTFVASNLAVSFAQVGERVLLIDGDLRKPRLHSVFGVPNLRGFSDLSDPDRLHELVRPCMLPNLHLLASGPAIPSPAEFLSRNRTQELLRAVVAKYDRVLFDTPPINLVADASNLAALADTVVLVIRDNGCTESELVGATERVRRSAVRIAGVVLNHVHQPTLAYGAAAYGRKYYPGMRDVARSAEPPAS